jgi:hypothetical protein
MMLCALRKSLFLKFLHSIKMEKQVFTTGRFDDVVVLDYNMLYTSVLIEMNDPEGITCFKKQQ